MLTIDNKIHVCFYQVSKTEEKYTPLPDHLIEGAKNREKEMIELDPEPGQTTKWNKMR